MQMARRASLGPEAGPVPQRSRFSFSRCQARRRKKVAGRGGEDGEGEESGCSKEEEKA